MKVMEFTPVETLVVFNICNFAIFFKYRYHFMIGRKIPKSQKKCIRTLDVRDPSLSDRFPTIKQEK